MASTRPVSGDGGDGVDLLGSAAALRWSRPDLTGSIADHVLETADADADDALWLRAAGWVVYACSATGDGRGVASVVLDGVARRGAHVLDEPAADRLRVELAVLATGADRLAAARTLLIPVAVADTAPELRADALNALARCAMQDRPASVEGLLRRVDATWAEVGGRRGHIGTAATSLVAAAAGRRAGRPEAAVERAAAGLASLDAARGSRAQSPSRHLAAGLAAEWLSGLLDAGRTAEAREGCAPMEPRLRDASRPSRQSALLRLTVARTVTGTGADAVAQAVAQAARDAVASDAPDLEAVCSSTLGALLEKRGQLGESLESTRRGEAARRRDEERARRFQTALDALVPVARADRPEEPLHVNGARHRTDTPQDPGVWTDWSSAVARDRTVPPTSPADRAVGPAQDDVAYPFASNHAPRHGSAGNGAAGAVPESASPWQGWTEDSPIGRLLARSLQAGDAAEPSARKQLDGTRPPRRYPDAVTDPWSTGSWSTGHWAAVDQPADGGSNGSAGGGRTVDEPRDDRGGRRRRAFPEDGLTTASGVDPVEEAGTGLSVRCRGSDRGSESSDRSTADASDAGDRGSSRSVRAEAERRAADRAAAERSAAEQAAIEQAADAENSAAERAAAERVAAIERDADRAVEPASGGWLQNALAELDRALAVSVPVASRPEAPAPEAEGCVVVVDLARDGRRFAGRRAGAVVRALAERLADRLPADARLRHDDSDALSVVLPGWTRSSATEWMHRTLPGLFEEFGIDEDLPGTQLRAAVHDTDGPVGAQLLQRLDGPGRARPAPGALTGGPLRESTPTGGGRRHRRAADGDQPEVSVEAAGTGRPDPAADTDGLGLGDLLAGALAAYRGI